MDTKEIARAQSALRVLNARIELQVEAMSDTRGDHAPLLIRCECGVSDCDTVIDVAHGELRAARLDGRHFLVAPGHGVKEVERVVASTDRFDVVETVGVAADVAVDLALRCDVGVRRPLGREPDRE